ncbi:MAG: ATP synthase F1 subunit delta [Chitinophagaceae bacterium]|nr:ATP synthase F1 subunit delta [Chitinophagaceae bacterium]
MQNPRLAARYAKSLIDIAVEQNQLEEVKAEVDRFIGFAKVSPEFRTLFKSPIISSDKKLAILAALNKGQGHPILSGFIRLLVSKGREKVVNEILDAFIQQYETLKGIHRVKITTAQPLAADVKASLLSKIKTDTGIDKVELTELVKEEIIGGFILEYDNKRVDASIQRDLRDVKRQFLSNDYIFNIR